MDTQSRAPGQVRRERNEVLMWQMADERSDLADDVRRGLVRAVTTINRQGDFFDPGREITLARAPGRLDLMGGIADYSGALVLQLPLAVATWVAVQAQDPPVLVIESADAGSGHISIPIEDI